MCSEPKAYKEPLTGFYDRKIFNALINISKLLHRTLKRMFQLQTHPPFSTGSDKF